MKSVRKLWFSKIDMCVKMDHKINFHRWTKLTCAGCQFITLRKATNICHHLLFNFFHHFAFILGSGSSCVWTQNLQRPRKTPMFSLFFSSFCRFLVQVESACCCYLVLLQNDNDWFNTLGRLLYRIDIFHFNRTDATHCLVSYYSWVPNLIKSSFNWLSTRLAYFVKYQQLSVSDSVHIKTYKLRKHYFCRRFLHPRIPGFHNLVVPWLNNILFGSSSLFAFVEIVGSCINFFRHGKQRGCRGLESATHE